MLVRGTGLKTPKFSSAHKGRGTVPRNSGKDDAWNNYSRETRDLVVRSLTINTPSLHLLKGIRKIDCSYMYSCSLFNDKFQICLGTRTEILPESVRTPKHPSSTLTKNTPLIADLNIFCSRPDSNSLPELYSIQTIISTFFLTKYRWNIRRSTKTYLDYLITLSD